MAVYFSGNSSNNIISVTECSFFSNQASFGGGLFCEFHDRAQNNNFSVTYSLFVNNSCYYNTKADGGGGGGARFAFLLYSDPDSIAGNEIYVGHSFFEKNTALFGGGLGFLTGREQKVSEASNQLRIDTCNFESNVARIGSAVCFLPWSLVSVGVQPNVTVQNCSFAGNSVKYSQEHLYMLGIGTLYSYSVQFDLEERSKFAYNTGSGIVVVGTGVNFKQGHHDFLHNHAGHGGGIAAFANGWMTLYERSDLYFANNSASAKGGAVYSESSGGHQILASRDCVFRYHNWTQNASDWNCSLQFVNNTATEGGNDIYVSSVYPCLWGSSGGSVNDSLSDREKVFRPPFWNAFVYDNRSDSILTAASNVFTKDQMNVTTFPGQLVDLSECCDFAPLDDFNETVTVPFYATVTSIHDTNPSVIKVTSDYTYMVRDIAFVRKSSIDEENVFQQVQLRTLSDPIMVFHFDVTVTACPPGTHSVASKGETSKEPTSYERCECSHSTSSGYLPGLVCVDEGTRIELFRKSYYWIGHLPPNMVIASGECPYCSIVSGLSRNVPLNLANLKDVCRTFHEGVLCGNCIHGVVLTSTLPTFECGSEAECSKTSSAGAWVLWICFQLILSTLVIGTVLLLDFNMVGGALCSFVFFNQITLSLNLHYCACDDKDIIRYLLIPYGIWSLQFGGLVPDKWRSVFCVSQLRNPLEALALDYIFAIYPFVLLVIVWSLAYCQDKGWCCRCCHRLCVRLNKGFFRFRQLLAQRTSLIHGIATCLVLTYGKLANISLHLLTPSYLNFPKNSSDDESALSTSLTRRAYFNGNWVYFETPHAYYGVLAILVMLVGVILPPLFLFSYPVLPQLMAKCSSHLTNMLNRFYNKRAIFHLLSIFQGHYKAKYYFYAGMWFVYRFVIYCNDAFNTEYYTVYFVQILCGVIFLLLHALMQPCQDKRHFVIDCLLFTNIVVLSCLAQLGGHTGAQPGVQPGVYVAAIAILLILPYAFFFGVLVYRIVRKMQGKFCKKNREQRHLLSPSQQTRKDDNGGEWMREGLIDSESYPQTPSDGKGQGSKEDYTPLVSSVTVEALPVQSKSRALD